jgi:3',5'-nucleoside bisphosphate phosphatase
VTAGAPADARFVDLHMHSTASDGSRTPEEVVTAARAANLAVIALTDHDTLGGVRPARETGERLGVRVVAGVELSAHVDEREHHLLGLHIASLDALEPRLVVFRDTRRTRAEQIVAKLNALGVPLTLDAVLAQAAGGAIGRPHIARALIAGRWSVDQRDAFDRYLGSGRPAYVPKHRLPMDEAIRMLHDVGALAVLAHPGTGGTRDLIEPLVAIGLDGLEVRHPSHSTEDMMRLMALANHFRLVLSGGSDWHGAPDGPRTIGNMRVPYEYLAGQEARLAARGTRAWVA